MTAKDFEDLRFVAEHADAVELSFTRSVREVETLQSELVRAVPVLPFGRTQPVSVSLCLPA